MNFISHNGSITSSFRDRLVINFFCAWDSKNRKTSWSGTHYSLFNSLSEFADVVDYPLLNDFASRFIVNLHKVIGKLTWTNDFMLTFSKLCERDIMSSNADRNAPCLMFTEFMTDYTHNSYLYQDLTVDYIYRIRKSDLELSRFTPLPPNVSDKKAKIRLEHTMKVNRSCAGLFTMSEYLARDLIENSGITASKVHHVGGGCNIDTSRINASHKNGRRFLFVGKGNWELKNGALVVSAFRKLREKYSDSELYIAGPSTAPSEINGVKGIKFLGRLSYDELADYYNLCDFFVLPSNFDAYGLVFPEALIFGLPCIGKNVCAMPEFIQDGVNGGLINNNDPDELFDCMERVMLDRNNLVSYVNSMHEEYLNRYSWSSVAERIIRVMRDDGF